MGLLTRAVTTLPAAAGLALFWFLLGTRPAAAQPAPAPPLQIHCDEELTFTQQDLAAALALRIPAQVPGGYVVVVRAAGDGTVEVSLGERRRSVYLGDHRGGAAARWVALAVEDLITQEAAPPLLPAAIGPVALVAPAPRLSFQLYPSVGLGTNENPLLATGGLGVSVRVYQGLRWTLDAGYGGSPKAKLHEVDIDLQELPLRSGPAWRLQRVPLELRLAAVVIPYWLRATATSAETQHGGVLAGGGVAIFTYLPLYRRLLAIVALGADLLASRAEFLVRGQPVFDTARFAVWLSAGLALRSQR